MIIKMDWDMTTDSWICAGTVVNMAEDLKIY